MTPTERLVEEHRVIEQVLDCLEAMCEGLDRGEGFAVEPARDALHFLRVFADGSHHAKEEDHLFRLLEAGGMPVEGGPVGVMLSEHERGRGHVREMTAALDGLPGGGDAARTRFRDHGLAFVDLLRNHIQKENTCLFPMADMRLVGEAQEHLVAAFRGVEAEEEAGEEVSRCLRIADDLATRYGVKKVQSRLTRP